MAIHAHPPGELVLAYAAGHLDEAAAVLVAAHLALCPACRAAAGTWEAVGGAVLEGLPATPVAPDLVARVTAAVEAPVMSVVPRQLQARPAHDRISFLPQPLRSYVAGDDLDSLPWRRLLDFEYVDLKTSGAAHGRLVRVQPGDRLPYHSHTGDEYTLVLEGGYGDCTGDYTRGDVAVAEPALAHEPVAAAHGPCICMTVNYGWLLPSRWLAPLGRLFGH